MTHLGRVLKTLRQWCEEEEVPIENLDILIDVQKIESRKLSKRQKDCKAHIAALRIVRKEMKWKLKSAAANTSPPETLVTASIV